MASSAIDTSEGLAMKISSLSAETVRRLLDYDPETGIFRWKEPPSRRVAVGAHAGAMGSNGRIYVSVLGERHLAHRLAWFHFHGVWPSGQITQRDGDYRNLAIGNLREETPAQMMQRSGLRATNKSGIKGVSWSGDKKMWIATITRDYRRVHIGYFHEIEDARVAYEAAAAGISEAIIPRRNDNTYAATKRRRQQMTIWRKTIRETHGNTGWASYDMFVATVGEIPAGAVAVKPLDPAKPVGPENFSWVIVEKAKAKNISKAEDIRRHRIANPSVYRGSDLKKNFGIDLAEYQRMFVEQGGVCACCGQPETDTRNGKVKWLAVDHDHTTGAIRGLLCKLCNVGIGHLGDSIERLTSAIAYLKRHAPKTEAAAANVVPLTKKEPPDGA